MKVLVAPMNNPLGVSPSKGNQGVTRGKEKSFELGGNRTHDLRIRSTVTLAGLQFLLYGRRTLADFCRPTEIFTSASAR